MKYWGEIPTNSPCHRPPPIHDGAVAAHAIIACRVPVDTKARFRQVAERQGLNESALFRQLLQVAIGASDTVDEPAPPQPDRPGRQRAVHVRLTVDDRQRLKERATARGIASVTYVSFLLRSHLSGHAPLPKAEYLLLRQAVLELSAIGRNLNQIARVINLKGIGALPGRTRSWRCSRSQRRCETTSKSC